MQIYKNNIVYNVKSIFLTHLLGSIFDCLNVFYGELKNYSYLCLRLCVENKYYTTLISCIFIK